jgi:FkbM family methyltransferase
MVDNYIKRLFKKIIPPAIWDYFRYIKFKIIKSNNFAPYSIDKKLEKYLDYKYGYFVELGANDGYTESNTLSLEIKKSWRGVLVEPAPTQFLNCCYYRSRPGNHLFCNACVPFTYDKKYVDIQYANLMSVSENLSTEIKDVEKHLISGRAHLINTARSIQFGAAARTLSSILDESNAPKLIDFLSLDVEGVELAVLKGIDFDKYKFKYMLIECRNFSVIEKFLKKYGYKKIDKFTHHDYLFTNE